MRRHPFVHVLRTLAVALAGVAAIPAAVALLSRWWLGERIGRRTAAGIGCAALGIAMLALATTAVRHGAQSPAVKITSDAASDLIWAASAKAGPEDREAVVRRSLEVEEGSFHDPEAMDNVAAIYGVETDEQLGVFTTYLVMQYVRGTTLREFVALEAADAVFGGDRPAVVPQHAIDDLVDAVHVLRRAIVHRHADMHVAVADMTVEGIV